MQLAAVEAEIRRLSTMFRLIRIRVEGWQGLSSVQTLSRLGLPVETLTPTVKTNADGWPVLAQRLFARTLARQHRDHPRSTGDSRQRPLCLTGSFFVDGRRGTS